MDAFQMSSAVWVDNPCIDGISRRPRIFANGIVSITFAHFFASIRVCITVLTSSFAGTVFISINPLISFSDKRLIVVIISIFFIQILVHGHFKRPPPIHANVYTFYDISYFFSLFYLPWRPSFIRAQRSLNGLVNILNKVTSPSTPFFVARRHFVFKRICTLHAA